jgi:hypothetical protein
MMTMHIMLECLWKVLEFANRCRAKRLLRFLTAAVLLFAFGGCAQQPNNQKTNISNLSSTPSLILPDVNCSPTDQDQYVYRPARLQLIKTCLRATGTVVEKHLEADGDVHIHLRVDASYGTLLNSGNQEEGGFLVVEAICQVAPPQADAMRMCASDPDPYSDALPGIGDHIWVEGRYILDLQHHAWAELHPLYRWGMINP